ncbi:MAG: molybdopterin molybdenumtransferase MoeA, partial [Bradyrhizobium sp.]|nr:molybdopterin molybdenumtransferase MoeA [Bradyrhizobium sp.]
MIGFDEACERIAALPERTAVECIPLDQAAGRILAVDIVASLDAPRADASAMDGYAVREADLARLPARLRLAGESLPGQPDLPEVGERACVRIFTGAPVPPGADRVVIQEQVTRDGGVVRFEKPLGPARHIRPQGGDFRSGEILLASGTRLDARSIVTAAAADLPEIEV